MPGNAAILQTIEAELNAQGIATRQGNWIEDEKQIHEYIKKSGDFSLYPSTEVDELVANYARYINSLPSLRGEPLKKGEPVKLMKLGRPPERKGKYVTISLAVREDLLAKIDASGKSRRQYIEMLLERERR